MNVYTDVLPTIGSMTQPTRAITPDEVVKLKSEVFPGEVITAFNNAIALAWNGHSSTVFAADVAAEIANKLSIPVSKVYELNYLDVEPIYRDAGWDVRYDKPGYDESYRSHFIFRKTSKSYLHDG